MEVIQLAGYTEEDEIAKVLSGVRQIVQARRCSWITFTDPGLRTIISDYTRGRWAWRQLEREIGNVCRKMARQIAEGAKPRRTAISRSRRCSASAASSPRRARTREPGVATGLTRPGGGDVLFVEAMGMPGSGNLTLTGSSGM